MTLKIKGASRNNHIAFGGMGKKKLGEYNQDELRKLAILAQSSKDKSVIALFDGELPPLKALQEEETNFRMGTVTKQGPAAKESKASSTGQESGAQKVNKA